MFWASGLRRVSGRRKLASRCSAARIEPGSTRDEKSSPHDLQVNMSCSGTPFRDVELPAQAPQRPLHREGYHYT